ncbi:unnamed protein product [Durusdinium trenchii]|uniref:Uncharacterized protein n=1 Tax=Durusdinium trenchii TaxID=1381693 RepID=A0ABP0QB81_9DINO
MVKKAAKKPAMEAEPKRRRKSAVSSPPAASPQIAEPKRRRKSVVSSSPRPTASPQTGRARSVEEAVPKGAESSVTSARATEPEAAPGERPERLGLNGIHSHGGNGV